MIVATMSSTTAHAGRVAIKNENRMGFMGSRRRIRVETSADFKRGSGSVAILGWRLRCYPDDPGLRVNDPQVTLEDHHLSPVDGLKPVTVPSRRNLRRGRAR